MSFGRARGNLSDRGARGRRTPRLLWILAVAGGFVLPLSLPSTAQSQPPPGRFLISPRGDVIVECNLDLSNCFSVVGGDPSHPVSGATQPSIAANGTIAFSAIWDAFGACIVGGQGICQRHVFLMDPDGSNVRQITFNPANASQFGGDRFPAISPDGTKVAFISNRNPSLDASNNASYLFQVYVVSTDGSGLRQVTLPAYDASGSPHGNMQGVAWSPDSTKLAFKGNVYTTACGTFFGSPIDVEVVGTINLDGTGTTYRACLGDTGTAIALDWSPDGTLIAYDRVSSTLGEPTVAFIDLSGDSIQLVAANVHLRSQTVSLGEMAFEPAVLGVGFAAIFDAHTHTHPIAPTGPPIPVPMPLSVPTNPAISKCVKVK